MPGGKDMLLLTLEISRVNESRRLIDSVRIGKEIVKEDLGGLFSQNEKVAFQRLRDFSLTTQFNEETNQIKLYGTGSGILLNGEQIDEGGKKLLISRRNNLQIFDYKFRCYIVVQGRRKKRIIEE